MRFGIGVVLLGVAACGSSARAPARAGADERVPCWVEAECGRYRSDRYLLAVGSGQNPVAAEAAARANLAKVFSVRVQQAQESIEHTLVSRASGGEEQHGTLAFRSETSTHTDQILEGVQIVERARAGGRHHALAVLERAPARARLEPRLQELAREIGRLAEAEGTRVERLRFLARAIARAEELAVSHARFRIIASADMAQPPSASLTELVGRYRDLRAELNVGLELAAPAETASAVAAALTAGGTSVRAEREPDLIITGEAVVDQRALERQGYTFRVVQWSLPLQIWAAEAGEPARLLREVTYRGSATSQREEKAQRLAQASLATALRDGDDSQPSLPAIVEALLGPGE